MISEISAAEITELQLGLSSLSDSETLEQKSKFLEFASAPCIGHFRLGERPLIRDKGYFNLFRCCCRGRRPIRCPWPPSSAAKNKQGLKLFILRTMRRVASYMWRSYFNIAEKVAVSIIQSRGERPR